jgi:protein involved in polysaccharide export with SLBB domain
MRIGSEPHVGGFSEVRFFVAVCTLGFCLAVSGCGGTNPIPASAAAIQALKAEAAAPLPLQPGERIRVIVFGEPSLTGNYQIDPSGFVSLPLAGAMKAKGLTPGQLERKLVKQFGKKYLKNPKITVEVTKFNPFYILGEVKSPGAYPYVAELNILSAFAIAGGRTYRADRSEVLIQHVGEKTMRKYNLDSPVPILPGDIIEVPRRFL